MHHWEMWIAMANTTNYCYKICEVNGFALTHQHLRNTAANALIPRENWAIVCWLYCDVLCVFVYECAAVVKRKHCHNKNDCFQCRRRWGKITLKLRIKSSWDVIVWHRLQQMNQPLCITVIIQFADGEENYQLTFGWMDFHFENDKSYTKWCSSFFFEMKTVSLNLFRFALKYRNSLECRRKYSQMRTYNFPWAKETERKIVALCRCSDNAFFHFTCFNIFVIFVFDTPATDIQKHSEEDLHCIRNKWRWWCYWNSWHNKNLSFLFCFETNWLQSIQWIERACTGEEIMKRITCAW